MRPDHGLNLRARRDDEVVVMAALEQLVGCSAASLTGPEGRLLCLGAEPIAVIADATAVGAVTARVGTATGLPTLLSLLTSVRPSGVLLLGSADGEHSLAVELDEGRVSGAVGPKQHQSMEGWVLELHRRFEDARGSESSDEDAAIVHALRPSSAFLQEALLEALTVCDQPGGSLLLLDGELQWLHERLEPEDAQDFGFVLMELARREDEGGELEERLGTVAAVATPVSKPPENRVTDRGMHIAESHDLEELSCPSGSAEWIDARYVFAFCDGITNVAGLVERALLGRFRTLSALAALRQHGHIRLVDGTAASPDEDADSSDELADLIAALS